jgi:hypothetical protein
MEEKDVEKSKPKYHHKYNNNNKRIETLEDLCHLLRNKTNQLYGDDQLMITMVTRLIEGKDAVDISTITLPAAVILYVTDLPFTGFSPVNGMDFEASLGLFNPLPKKTQVLGKMQISSRFLRTPLVFQLHLYFLFSECLKFVADILCQKLAILMI